MPLNRAVTMKPREIGLRIRSITMKAALFLLLLFFFFFFLVGFASAAFITGDVFQSRGSNSRSLLQTKQNCPITFEFLNYTILTSKCKGPQYPPLPCCSAFKEFACPHADLLNNGTNTCANDLFSYIHSNGNFPNGLFSSECSDEKDGISCPSELSQNTTNVNGGSSEQSLSIALLLVSGFSMALQLS
ncbi:GPI-anchored protein LLG1-like [Typha latifolia]|uniref:GPI-anchored protein LLG1-like n=1 Tax=Typha latifolia TaxID=4733 RepID=UPI003C2EB60B